MIGAYPRLLVATEFSPNASGGGATIVRQMLQDWPADRLFWWSSLPDKNSQFGRKVAAHYLARIPARFYPLHRLRAQKSWILEQFWKPWAVRHFRRSLSLIRPDAIWVIPHGWVILPLGEILPQTKIGFHVSIHDNPDVRGMVKRLGVERIGRMTGIVNGLYRAATSRDAICQQMADDLRATTGKEGMVVRAGLEQQDFDYLLRNPESRVDTIRIAYAGTILVEEEFDLFVRSIARIRDRLCKQVYLEFYGGESFQLRKWFDSAWMREHGSLPAHRLSQELRQCTWGFAPMRLNDEDPRYNRFSLPTKFSSYLAAGLPIIVLGHPESTVVKMATAYKVGHCASTSDLGRLSEQLFSVLSNPNPGLTYRAEILRCSKAEFDARRMRGVLFEFFQRCAARSKEIKVTAAAAN